VDAAPALPTAKASAVDEFRGSITRLWHLLPTLQERCVTIPARLTSGWLARLCREGVDPLDRCQRFQVIHPPFLDLAWRKGSFMLNLPLASHHSITSSARPSSVSGKVRPSVFEVLRLITNSIFVDCWTGSPAGFSPLRILAV